MTQAEIQDLFSDGPCVVCYNNHQLLQIIAILAWKNFAGDVPMTSTDIQNLFESSPCVNCYNDHRLLQIIAMLTASGVVSPSGVQIKEYTADPNVEGIAPANVNLPALAYQEGGLGDFYSWNTTTHVWQ